LFSHRDKTTDNGQQTTDKLKGLRPHWHPARRSYAPEGMMEFWNMGMMGFDLRLGEEDAADGFRLKTAMTRQYIFRKL